MPNPTSVPGSSRGGPDSPDAGKGGVGGGKNPLGRGGGMYTGPIGSGFGVNGSDGVRFTTASRSGTRGGAPLRRRAGTPREGRGGSPPLGAGPAPRRGGGPGGTRETPQRAGRFPRRCRRPPAMQES